MWLIFRLPPAEVAVHPADTSATAELDPGWGPTTIRLPGGGRLGLYEARHPTAFEA